MSLTGFLVLGGAFLVAALPIVFLLIYGQRNHHHIDAFDKK